MFRIGSIVCINIKYDLLGLNGSICKILSNIKDGYKVEGICGSHKKKIWFLHKDDVESCTELEKILYE